MKIIDVLQRYEDEKEIIWTFVVEDLKSEYVENLRKIDKNYDYVEDYENEPMEIDCVTENGKVVKKYNVNLQYYFDNYELIDILNDDNEAIKCIEDFVKENGNKLPNSEDMGQIEYSDVVREIMNW